MTGEGSGARRATSSGVQPLAWTQTSIFPPEHVMATLRVAYIAETRHVQWQIEVVDPITNELLAMRSVPHAEARSSQDALAQALTGLRVAWDDVLDPDPF